MQSNYVRNLTNFRKWNKRVTDCYPFTSKQIKNKGYAPNAYPIEIQEMINNSVS